MAVKKDNVPVVEGYVEITIPRYFGSDDQNYFCSVNGVNYLIPRGKRTAVPPEVAEEVKRALEAEVGFDDTVDELRSK